MNEIKVIDLAAYVTDGEFLLENVTLENCKVMNLHCDKILYENCKFHNVVFDDHFDDHAISSENCEFIHCEFHINFGQSYLTLEDNLFRDCLFENINLDYGSGTSYMKGNGFLDCNFMNVKLQGDTEYIDQYIRGGKIENAVFISNNMNGNQFLEMQFKDVEIGAYFIGNKMYSVSFENVLLKGVLTEMTGANNLNVFFHCDTSGFRFKDQNEE